MKALVWTAVETMSLKETTRPTPRPDEVVIHVEAVGICGSEIEGYLGHNSLRVPPLVMGHEFCGRIEECGEQVATLQPDQKVVVNPLLSCGRCARCRKGLPQHCERRAIIGIHRPGGFAEWVVVPSQAVIPVPDDINSFRVALAEPLACALRATRRAIADYPFANVLIFGAGGIGILSARVARILGASAILMADTNNERLAMALRTGVDYVVNPRDADLLTEVRAAMGDKGVDVVIDSAGFQPTRETALKVLNPGGTLMNIGLGIDETNLPINYLTRNEIQILGSFCYTHHDFAASVDLLVSGRVTESGWTEVRPFDAAGNAFADLVAGRVTSGKILLGLNQGAMA